MQYQILAHGDNSQLIQLCDSLLPFGEQLQVHLFAASEIHYPASASFAKFEATLIYKPLSEHMCEVIEHTNNPSHLLFFNGVTGLFSDFFKALNAAIECNANCPGWMLRSLPHETQHHIDPVTLQSHTLGPIACCVRRDALLEVRGFDSAFEGAAMWDELSLRLRAAIGPLYYLPKAAVQAPLVPENQEDSRRAYIDSIISPYLLALKYGDRQAVHTTHRNMCAALRNPKPYPHIRKYLLQHFRESLRKSNGLKRWRRQYPALFAQMEEVCCSTFGFSRGKSALPAPVTEGPRFTVVIRTHNRASLLRGALQSVANQTYNNYNIVVVEDGAPTAQNMIEKEFSHLSIIYIATGDAVGRSRAGNMGLALATGEYLNFLDDDDYLYPDHLEQMAAQALAHPDADLILGCAVSMFTDNDSSDEKVRANARYALIRFDRVDVFTMSQMCQIPLMSGTFKKELFNQVGGLHEGLDAHEDWAMWLKFLSVAHRANPTSIDIQRATSVFLQPDSHREAQRRLEAYRVYDSALFSDESIKFTVSLADMRRFYDDMLADIAHVKQLGQLDAFLEQQMHRDEQ